MDIVLPVSGRKFSTPVIRKKIKTCRLRVYPDSTAVLSVPQRISQDWVDKFLAAKAGWLEKKLEHFAQITRINSVIDLDSADSIMMYGRKMDVIIKSGEVEPPEAAKSARHAKPAEPAKTQEPAEPAKLAETKNPAKSEETEKAVKLLKPLKAAISLEKEGKAVIISGVGYTPGKCDNESLKLLFEKWWRSEALDYFKARIEAFYPIVQKHDVRMPAIALRKMKTVWGSCSLKNKKITFSYYLAAVEPSCIDYVVLHELVHLIHPNHSRQFYSFLGTYMPDWKKRREALRRYSVCSLPFPAK